MTQAESIEQLEVPLASRKRRVLAIYFDFILFGTVWAVATNWMTPFFGSLWLRLAAFGVLESLLFRNYKSIGLYVLSVYRYPVGGGEVLGVNPAVKHKESWLTMIMASLLLLDGPRAVIRWTQFRPPKPYFGMVPDTSVAILYEVAFGVTEVFVAIAIFKMSRTGFWAALVLAAGIAVSTLMSLDQFSEYAQTYVRRRADYTGRDFDPQMAEAMAPIVTYGTITVAAMLATCVLFYRKRFSNPLQDT